jgi:uncharacterized membrane protein
MINNLGLGVGGIQLGALLNQLLQKFAFWSKDTDTDYYASLEDDSPYYSVTEKE